MRKFENFFKLAVYLLSCLRDWLVMLVRIIHSGQHIPRVLYSSKFINEQLQPLAIFPVVRHQYVSVCHILCLLPMMPPHEAL
jgi:hypothetical protein